MLPSFLVAGRTRGRHETSASTALALLPRDLASSASRQRRSSPHRRYRSRNCREIRRLRDREVVRRILPSQRRGDEQTDALEHELRAIREQVEQLERQRLLLQSAAVTARCNATGYALAQVRQFYELFAEGFNPETRPGQSAVAERFLRSIMVEDVICAEFRGVDTFLRQYHVCTIGHQSMRLVFEDALVINEGACSGSSGRWGDDEVIQVRANAVARLRMSRETFKLFFPRIMEDEELAQKLIGKEYMLQYDKVFHFRGGRVFQHESKVDFVTGMLTMVQNPFVATKLIEASVMTKHGHLKVDNGISEDLHMLEGAALDQ